MEIEYSVEDQTICLDGRKIGFYPRKSYKKRGWKGLGICPLCKNNTEDINHLHCIFSETVWARISFLLKVKKM